MQLRRLRLLVIYAILLLPMMIFEASQALRGTVNSPIEWAPATDTMQRQYHEFAATFGSGDVVVASWPGCEVGSSQLDSLLAHLSSHASFFADSNWMFDHVVSGRDFVRQLMGSGIPFEAAVQQLQGTLIGPDGLTTCIVVGFTKQGVEHRATLIPLLQQAIQQQCNVAATDQHLVGPVMYGMTVDSASQASVQHLAPISTAVAFIVALVCLGSLRDAFLVIIVSIYCQGLTLAAISLAGESLSALLVVLPPLIQVLALAGGVHLVNYYRDAVRTRSPLDAANRAMQVGWLPCVLSSTTTAVGMASLMFSEFVPIRSFGAFSTAGILATAAVLLAFIPQSLGLWNHTFPERTPRLRMPFRFWRPLTTTLAGMHELVVIIFAVAMIGAGVGLAKMTTSVHIGTLFHPKSRILRDYQWLEANVGPQVPIEVLVEFQSGRLPTNRKQLAIAQFVEQRLASRPEVGGTMSAATFVPAALQMQPGEQNRLSKEALDAAEQAMSESLPGLADMGLIADTSRGDRQWRIRAFVSSSDNINYDLLLDAIDSDLASSLVDQNGTLLQEISVRTTGIMPLVHRIQHQLMDDLRNSFLLAFAIILLVMTVLQGSILAGILVMIPNVLPTLLLFGSLGWLEMPIDIGSAMTVSVALGVAVDDTLHFLTAFQRELSLGRNRRLAVLSAYDQCGTAMIQTSVICAAGMSVFAVSSFLPTAKFAWMMVGLFAAAILGHLLLLPALLLGPLGFLFESRDADPTRDQHSSAASILRPGPNGSKATVDALPTDSRRTSTAAILGDDILP